MAISTAVDLSAIARVTGIKTEFVNFRSGGTVFLPQRVAVFGQGSTIAAYDTVKRQVTSALEAAQVYGFGSPIHLSCLQLLPRNGDGVGTIPVTIYPLVDDGAGVAASGSITPAGTQLVAASYRASISGQLSEEFVISAGDNIATITASIATAINSVLSMPVVATATATEVELVAKWAGESGNDIKVSIIGSTTAGVSFATSQLSGGLVNPNIDDALAQVGNVWETLFVNCFNIDDTVTLDKFSVFGEGRRGALTHKPMVAFVGNTIADRTLATTVSDSRKSDRVNGQIPAPGSDSLPLEIASRAFARIAPLANNNPPHDYGSQSLTGIDSGSDGVQWDYLERDAAVKRGSSTTEVRDGVVTLSDVTTFYHPEGDIDAPYRFLVDHQKLNNIIFNVALLFNSTEWDGAPLIPDSQETVNPSAKTPKAARAEVFGIIDGVALNAIISDPDTAKQNTVAEINAKNPKRLDVRIPVQLSGNTNIKSVDIDFGFFFGG